MELESDPISNARFSTPRPGANKRQANAAFHLSSAKKRKIVRVQPRAPHFAVSESHLKDASKETGLLAAHPTLLIPTCEPTESLKSKETGGAEDNKSIVPARMVEDTPMLAASGGDEAQDDPYVGRVEDEAPDHLMEPAECISPVERVMNESPESEAIRSAASPDVVRPPTPEDIEEGEVLASGRAGASAPLTGKSPLSHSDWTTLPKKPPAFSVSISGSESSPHEAGLLAAHPTLEVQTCGTEDFVSPTERGQEPSRGNLSVSNSQLPDKPVQESEPVVNAAQHAQVPATPHPAANHAKGAEDSSNAKASMGECISPAAEDEVEVEDTVERSRRRRFSSTKRTLILYSDSQPQEDEEELDEPEYSEDLSVIQPTPPPVPVEPPPSRTPQTSDRVHVDRRRSEVLVPETPSSDGVSPILVDETPNDNNLPSRASRPGASAATPATGHQRATTTLRARRTPPTFAGFTPGSAHAGSATGGRVSPRSRRVSWSDGYNSHPLCAQTPSVVAETPATRRPSPPIVLGTKLRLAGPRAGRGAGTPRAVTMTWSRGLFSTAESIHSSTPSPSGAVSPTGTGARSAEKVTSAADAEEDAEEDRVLVPETCVPATLTPDPVCQRALDYVNARARRYLEGGDADESDASTEPPPKDEARMRRIFRTFDAHKDDMFRNAPQPTGLREGVPSGALAVLSDSDGDDDE